MRLITNVQSIRKSYVNENLCECIVECSQIKTEYKLDVEYDGRDVLVYFPVFSKIELEKWFQTIMGLFDSKSNFKQLLFQTFSYLRGKKKFNYIFTEINGVVLQFDKDSDPFEVMRDYYRSLNYVVLDGDTDQMIQERSSKLLKLYTFVYDCFLKDYYSSLSEEERKPKFFLTDEEEEEYEKREKALLHEKFNAFLRTYEMNPEASQESKDLLVMMKKCYGTQSSKT